MKNRIEMQGLSEDNYFFFFDFIVRYWKTASKMPKSSQNDLITPTYFRDSLISRNWTRKIVNNFLIRDNRA